MKKFVQIIIQKKIGADNDWRSFCICEDSEGDRWELRGYGKNPAEAAADAYKAFQNSEEDWHWDGYTINKED